MKVLVLLKVIVYTISRQVVLVERGFNGEIPTVLDVFHDVSRGVLVEVIVNIACTH